MYENYPSMNVNNLAARVELERLRREKANVKYFINKTELNTVKTLFQLRNANYYKVSVMPVQLSDYSTDIYPKERVFIAGKIFPFINIVFTYANVKDIKQFIKPIFTQLVDGASRIKHYDSRIHNSKYISINNNRMAILLPKNYGKIDFPQLMFDFLTNKKSVDQYIGGEFPDLETYRLALRDKAIPEDRWIGQDGCWLEKHRTNKHNNVIWRNAIMQIIKNKWTGRLAPFSQIYGFYNYVDGVLKNLGHEVKWCKGAKALVLALSESPLIGNVGSLEGGSSVIDNDVETILNELNLGICDFAIEKFHELIFGKYAKTPLKGNDAYNWDVAFVTHEQQVIAPPIYKKTSTDTIRKYQKMADKDGLSSSGISSLGFGSWRLNKITPAFDDFNPPAKVTDDLFRTDLPLLMLYLDKHKIDKNKCSLSFKNYLTLDGHINDKCKEIIRPFAL